MSGGHLLERGRYPEASAPSKNWRMSIRICPMVVSIYPPRRMAFIVLKRRSRLRLARQLPWGMREMAA